MKQIQIFGQTVFPEVENGEVRILLGKHQIQVGGSLGIIAQKTRLDTNVESAVAIVHLAIDDVVVEHTVEGYIAPAKRINSVTIPVSTGFLAQIKYDFVIIMIMVVMGRIFAGSVAPDVVIVLRDGQRELGKQLKFTVLHAGRRMAR